MVRPVIRVPYASEASGKEGGRLVPKVEPMPMVVGPSHATVGMESSSASHGRRHVMSKVPSLMFDMEDTEETVHANQKAHKDLVPEADVIEEITSLLETTDDRELMLRLHVRIASEEATRLGMTHLSVPDIANTLRKLGYAVKIRTALGGGWGGACLRNLRHSFLAVTISPTTSEESSRTVIVDPRFREQFQIAHATPRYDRILAAAPTEMIASSDRLANIVEILCGEMATAFAETGTPLPPWRQTSAMLSKWHPRRSEEVDLSKSGTYLAGALNNATGIAFNHHTAMDTNQSHGAFASKANNEIHGNAASKLAALGFEPQSPPSTVSEGDESDSWTSAAFVDDINLLGENVEEESEEEPAYRCAAEDQRVNSAGSASAVAAAILEMAKPMEAVWMGIKEAVASTPLRRSTWG